MKSTFRQVCCLFLIGSLILQCVPAAMAQTAQVAGPMASVRTELLEARRILCEDASGKEAQSAIPPLDRAKRLADERGFAKAHPPKLVKEFQEGIAKARLKVLWNDQKEALAIVNRLLGLADGKKPVVQTPAGNTPGAGAALGVTLVAGLGAAFLAVLLGFGQVSHR
jgi:hypothetical protein